MTTLIITPSSNTSGKKDFTGAFQPESLAFKKMLATTGKFGVSIVQFDNTLPFEKRSKALYQQLVEEHSDDLVFFCHGWSDGIQAGFRRKDIKKLVTAWGPNDNERAILYCCSTGSDPQDDSEAAPGQTREDADFESGVGEGSFADTLRDELCKAGAVDCRVVAHTTAGHTTQNPHVVFFEGLGSHIGGIGGMMPVPPKHKLWKTWVKALKGDLRFRYPYMSIAEIHDELSKL
jgi:hypothetical protein